MCACRGESYRKESCRVEDQQAPQQRLGDVFLRGRSSAGRIWHMRGTHILKNENRLVCIFCVCVESANVCNYPGYTRANNMRCPRHVKVDTLGRGACLHAAAAPAVCPYFPGKSKGHAWLSCSSGVCLTQRSRKALKPGMHVHKAEVQNMLARKTKIKNMFIAGHQHRHRPCK